MPFDLYATEPKRPRVDPLEEHKACDESIPKTTVRRLISFSSRASGLIECNFMRL